jgi:hypothetical protein
MFTLKGSHTFVSSTRKIKVLSIMKSSKNNLKTEVIMKTLKFALIAAIVACTMVSLANEGGIKEKPAFKKIIVLTLQKAATNPGLVEAIYQQISRDDILNSPGHIFVAELVYQGNIYHIRGTLEQWIEFYTHAWDLPVSIKKRADWN